MKKRVEIERNYITSSSSISFFNIRNLLIILLILIVAAIVVYFGFKPGMLIPSPENEFYVDTNSIGGTCSDSNPGSIDQPWCTIQKAANTLEPGQTVYIREGVYKESVKLTKSGTESGRIEFRNYPGENPVITGSDIFEDWNLVSDNIYLLNNFSYLNGYPSAVCKGGFENKILCSNKQLIQDGRLLKETDVFCNESFASYSLPIRLIDYDFAAIQENLISDNSGNGNNGIIQNAVIKDGLNGNAIELNSTDSSVNISFSQPLNDNYSISLWFNQEYSKNAKLLTASIPNASIFIGIGANGALTASSHKAFTSNWSDNYVSPRIIAVPNRWYHIVFVVNGGNLSLYLNGNLIANKLYSNDLSEFSSYISVDKIFIGSALGRNTNVTFNGLIDDFRLYDNSLGASVIKNIYLGEICNHTSYGLVEPGTFYVEPETNLTYARFFGDVNPAGHKIELSKRTQLFYNIRPNLTATPPIPRVDYITISGISGIYAKNHELGAFEFFGDNLIIENNNISWTNQFGLLVKGDNNIIRNNSAEYNGRMGIGGSGLGNLWENNSVIYNNLKGFGLEGGFGSAGSSGMKITSSNNSILRNNYAAYNKGVGIWLDINNNNNIIENSISHDDAYAGIMVEISGMNGGNIVRNNIVYNTKNFGPDPARALLVQDSVNTKVYNNVVYNSSAFGINVHYSEYRDEAGAKRILANNIVRNNIAFNNAKKQIYIENQTCPKGVCSNIVNGILWFYSNIEDYNLIYGNQTDILGEHSINANPMLEDPLNYNFIPDEDSPAIDAGKTLLRVRDDILGNSRPQNHKWDIGSYELVRTADDSGKVLELSFEDNTDDFSGFSNNGAVFGDSYYTSGILGKGIHLDGDKDYIIVNDSSSLHIEDEITISAWVKSDTNPRDFMAKTGWNCMRMILNESINHSETNNVKTAYTIGENNLFLLSGNNTINTNQWYNIVFSYNGKIAKLYINGELKAYNDSIKGKLVTNSYPLMIGGYKCNETFGDVRCFNGTLDEIKIYNKSLSSHQIVKNYEDILIKRLAKFSFENIQDNITFDSLNSSINGTLHNVSVVDSIKGQAVNFSLNNSFVDLGNKTIKLYDKYSIAFFLNLNADQFGTVFASNYGTNMIVRYDNTTKTIHGIAYQASSSYWPDYDLYGKTEINLGEWNHFVFVVDGTNLSFYLNGKLDSSTLINAVNLSYRNSSSYIGQTTMSWNRAFLNGSVDELEIYNQALSPKMISSLYSQISCGNSVCNSGETCDSCPSDCGECQSQITISLPAQGQTYRTLVPLVFNFSDEMTTAYYTIDSINKNTTGTISSISLDDGDKILTVYASNSEGLISNQSVSFSVDHTYGSYCGDSVCDADIGETCETCGFDCGTCEDDDLGRSRGSATYINNSTIIQNYTLIPNYLEEDCTDSCSSLRYSCGEFTICGEKVNCGVCSSEEICSSSGICLAQEILKQEGLSPTFKIALIGLILTILLVVAIVFFVIYKKRDKL